MINISKLYCGLAGQSDDLRYSAASSFGPVVVYNCTSRCNLHCLHCYSSSKPDDHRDELTTAEAKQLLSQLVDTNCPVLLLSGGEPLLRDDLFELLSEAKQLGLRTVISTNGTLIDSATARQLAELGVKYVGISIDGDENFHDKFRGSKGAFKAALAGIENCKKAGIKTGLRFTITKVNRTQIPAVFDIAASAGIRRICFYHLICSGRAKQLYSSCVKSDAYREKNQRHTQSENLTDNTQYEIRNTQYEMTPQQTRQAVDIIIEKTDDFAGKGLIDEVLTVGNHADGPYLLLKMRKQAQNSKPSRSGPDGLKTQNYQTARRLLLDAGGNKIGESIVCLSWDGSVHADQFWRNYSLGNVRDKSFKEIWQNSSEPVLNKLRNKAQFADKRCRRCKWFDLCKGNYRFLGAESDDKYWLNEPACYLTDEEIENSKIKMQSDKSQFKKG